MDTDLSSLPYRPCVGLALFNTQGKVFVGERIDTRGAWQMPQGGIDEGENPQDAAYRELYEEIGVQKDKVSLIKKSSEILRYDLPSELQKRLWGGRFRGQEQHWFALRFHGTKKDINIHHHNSPEFVNWQWIALTETINFVVPFKKHIYARVIEIFSNISA